VRIGIAIALATLAISMSATADVVGYCVLSNSGTSLTSATTVDFNTQFICIGCEYLLFGDHGIHESNSGGIVNGLAWGVGGTHYRDFLSASGAPGSCYYSTNSGTVYLMSYNGLPPGMPQPPFLPSSLGSGGPWQSSTTCIAAPPPPKCQLTVVAGGGGSLSPNPSGSYDCGTSLTLSATPGTGYHFVSWSGSISSTNPTITFTLNGNMSLTVSFEPDDPPQPPDPGPQCGDTGWVGQCSPIIINFETGNYRLTGANAPVMFDINAIGRPAKIGWTAAGADESFLWLDRNHNGIVDDGSELFGTATPLANGLRAPNGFEALKELDSNHDHVIDSRDAIWPQLKLWRDSNHNGIAEPSEISSIVGSRVTAIAVPYAWTGLRDSYGNMFKYGSLVWVHTSGFSSFPRPVFDIFFVSVP
jgi:hypothetical protein